MGLIGKIIGGTIGFALGGPLGAIAGAAFGHAYDAGNTFERSTERLSYGEESQLTFFTAAFSMLAKVAKVDGRVSEDEIRSIRHFMTHDLNMDPQGQHAAMNIFNTALNSQESFYDFAVQFYTQFQHKPEMLELMMDILLRVAIADGVLSKSEEDLIISAANIFMFSDGRYRQLKSRYVTDVDKYYAVLGCQRTDPDDQIKRRYRKLVTEYHPDKIASKGLPEEFTKFANDKFREIQEAYEKIKKERGIR